MASLTFEKLDLQGNRLDEPMTVAYAPAELAFAKGAQFAEIGVPGLEAPILQFVRGEATTISMDLFFDSTEAGTGGQAVAVTAEVEKFHKLVSIRGDLHHPPLVRVTWGADFPGPSFGDGAQAADSLTAVVLSVGRRFTLFNPDGKPLRAVVSLSLKQYATVAEQVAAINYQSADHTRIHVVQEGETLPLIAFDAYGDARRWRVIADHNALTDVRRLTPGRTLELPPLV